ncbi:MAG: hypothetical protein ACKVVT_15225 [Dehalococcoidia bacterium]
MASYLDEVIDEFVGRVQATKNRHVAIPAASKLKLGLDDGENRQLIQVSIRPQSGGHWNHHYFKLTHDGCFAIPTDVSTVSGGDLIDVKVHRIITPCEHDDAGSRSDESPLAWLANQAEALGGWRVDGASRHDDYLRDDMRRSNA